ncbi:hypothetical protein MYCTH_2110542 [Thermothelomyces thermophilus ATCC 42464]|uniref:UDP-glucose 6-dehydrogenase n=1 Tax=Thermothelomyces thermophilus (strain ATCC 42464 / BCRC 31852 / DSM 1799) TaxID=573729 RepID=G2QCR9_THET4|nr:uncharacterized protein MYCTH_2110542 [Thermothelomyces thermophilus ATCC 42464]AEO58191.1 hypothetical protein MYCTH_2110542 [Thermothelomyces thermophilus ATCC 42464]
MDILREASLGCPADLLQRGPPVAAVFKDVYAAWVPACRRVTANTFSSELTELVANTMLVQRISSINAVSVMCKEINLGADVDDVSPAVGKDERLGSKLLQAGVGFGGSCFEKDIRNLAYLAKELHLDINEDQRQRFARRVVRELNGSLRGKKIVILGFTFKDGTNDTRNSIAVHVIKDLASEMRQEIAVFDPGCAAADILEEVRRIGLSTVQMERVKISAGWRWCIRGPSAACILTPWRQFHGRGLGNRPTRPAKTAKSGAHVFAARGPDGSLRELSILEIE